MLAFCALERFRFKSLTTVCKLRLIWRELAPNLLCETAMRIIKMIFAVVTLLRFSLFRITLFSITLFRLTLFRITLLWFHFKLLLSARKISFIVCLSLLRLNTKFQNRMSGYRSNLKHRGAE